MNISIPVGCIARLIPFHDAIIVYFWRAVSGNRGSGADGGGSSMVLVTLQPPDFVLDANLPSSQPISLYLFFFSLSLSLIYFFLFLLHLFLN